MNGGEAGFNLWAGAGALAAAAALSAGLILLLRPLLFRYALARPNARSSHHQPTPQGGGIAVLAATILVTVGAFLLAGDLNDAARRVSVVLAAAAFIAIVGGIDDVRPLPVVPRLVLQVLATVAAVAMLPTDVQILPSIPWWVERLGLVVALLWFVNLVNFM